jgi:hypothetical protein
MGGNRVKRRLWWLEIIGRTISIITCLTGFLGTIWAGSSIEWMPSGKPWTSVIWWGVPIAAYFLGAVAFAMTCVRLKWMSWMEAREFLSFPKRWPESWLDRDTKDTQAN